MVKLLKRIWKYFSHHKQQKSNKALLERFYQQQNIPWSDGYSLHKWKSIEAALHSDEILAIFAQKASLPKAFGWRLDERIVEYPWLFSRLQAANLRSLDAGSALNHAPIVKLLLELKRNLTIITLAPENQAFWKDGISYQYGDLREIPFQDAYFDEIISISTLEHIGWSNEIYGTANDQKRTGTVLNAALELWRVLKVSGSLYITVPYGLSQDIMVNNQIFAKQFDAVMLANLLDCFPSADIETVFYKYTAAGWQISTQSDCDGLSYYNVHLGKPFDSDVAAAARAVCCIRARKVML